MQRLWHDICFYQNQAASRSEDASLFQLSPDEHEQPGRAPLASGQTREGDAMNPDEILFLLMGVLMLTLAACTLYRARRARARVAVAMGRRKTSALVDPVNGFSGPM